MTPLNIPLSQSPKHTEIFKHPTAKVISHNSQTPQIQIKENTKCLNIRLNKSIDVNLLPDLLTQSNENELQLSASKYTEEAKKPSFANIPTCTIQNPPGDSHAQQQNQKIFSQPRIQKETLELQVTLDHVTVKEQQNEVNQQSAIYACSSSAKLENPADKVTKNPVTHQNIVNSKQVSSVVTSIKQENFLQNSPSEMESLVPFCQVTHGPEPVELLKCQIDAINEILEPELFIPQNETTNPQYVITNDRLKQQDHSKSQGFSVANSKYEKCQNSMLNETVQAMQVLEKPDVNLTSDSSCIPEEYMTRFAETERQNIGNFDMGSQGNNTLHELADIVTHAQLLEDDIPYETALSLLSLSQSNVAVPENAEPKRKSLPPIETLLFSSTLDKSVASNSLSHFTEKVPDGIDSQKKHGCITTDVISNVSSEDQHIGSKEVLSINHNEGMQYAEIPAHWVPRNISSVDKENVFANYHVEKNDLEITSLMTQIVASQCSTDVFQKLTAITSALSQPNTFTGLKSRPSSQIVTNKGQAQASVHHEMKQNNCGRNYQNCFSGGLKLIIKNPTASSTSLESVGNSVVPKSGSSLKSSQSSYSLKHSVLEKSCRSSVVNKCTGSLFKKAVKDYDTCKKQKRMNVTCLDKVVSSSQSRSRVTWKSVLPKQLTCDKKILLTKDQKLYQTSRYTLKHVSSKSPFFKDPAITSKDKESVLKNVIINYPKQTYPNNACAKMHQDQAHVNQKSKQLLPVVSEDKVVTESQKHATVEFKKTEGSGKPSPEPDEMVDLLSFIEKAQIKIEQSLNGKADQNFISTCTINTETISGETLDLLSFGDVSETKIHDRMLQDRRKIKRLQPFVETRSITDQNKMLKEENRDENMQPRLQSLCEIPSESPIFLAKGESMQYTGNKNAPNDIRKEERNVAKEGYSSKTKVKKVSPVFEGGNSGSLILCNLEPTLTVSQVSKINKTKSDHVRDAKTDVNNNMFQPTSYKSVSETGKKSTSYKSDVQYNTVIPPSLDMFDVSPIDELTDIADYIRSEDECDEESDSSESTRGIEVMPVVTDHSYADFSQNIHRVMKDSRKSSRDSGGHDRGVTDNVSARNFEEISTISLIKPSCAVVTNMPVTCSSKEYQLAYTQSFKGLVTSTTDRSPTRHKFHQINTAMTATKDTVIDAQNCCYNEGILASEGFKGTGYNYLPGLPFPASSSVTLPKFQPNMKNTATNSQNYKGYTWLEPNSDRTANNTDCFHGNAECNHHNKVTGNFIHYSNLDRSSAHLPIPVQPYLYPFMTVLYPQPPPVMATGFSELLHKVSIVIRKFMLCS